MSIISLVRDIWMSNACVKFEERSLKPSKVICVADENIIFPELAFLENIISVTSHLLTTFDIFCCHIYGLLSCINSSF